MIARALLILLLFVQSARAATDLSGFAYEQRLGSQMPLAAVFQDEQGRAISLRQAIGQRPTILVAGYFHCPNLCGLERDDLMSALAGLPAGRAYSLIVLSIDPTETPDDARSAKALDVGRFGRPEAAVDWRYLTGPEVNVRAVADAVGLHFVFDAASKQFLHPAGMVFLTRSGIVSGYLLGLGYQPNDVSVGLTRAADGVMARALPVLLLCFHFDEVTGRYTLSVMRVLQLGGAITVLVIGVTVTLALRRERRVD
jgi:protein SCO1/2